MKPFVPTMLSLSDSYKYSHAPQYPPNTTKIVSYLESRGGAFADKTQFNGLQPILMEYFTRPITASELLRVERKAGLHFNNPNIFNKDGWVHILNEHKGLLPLSIKAVPEGTVVPKHNCLMTIENTCDKCFWVTNFAETILSHVWSAISVGTLSMEMRKMILAALEKSGTPELIDFKLHDFGFRGASSVQTAMLAGMAHLINFKGTDTFIALDGIEHYYNEFCAGFSIPASEHSTVTSWGKSREVAALLNMLNTYEEGFVAMVSDSYNIWDLIKNGYGGAAKDLILNRKGTVVVRPDSGTPWEIVPQVLNALADQFGYTINSKGYKVLPPQLAVIQGDGIKYGSTAQIIEAVLDAGWSMDNVAFGMGGGLLQQHDRDEHKFAIKCSFAITDQGPVDVYKDPITDSGKRSKAGLLKLVNDWDMYPATGWGTVKSSDPHYNTVKNQLVEVLRDGEMKRIYDWPEVRANAAASY